MSNREALARTGLAQPGALHGGGLELRDRGRVLSSGQEDQRLSLEELDPEAGRFAGLAHGSLDHGEDELRVAPAALVGRQLKEARADARGQLGETGGRRERECPMMGRLALGPAHGCLHGRGFEGGARQAGFVAEALGLDHQLLGSRPGIVPAPGDPRGAHRIERRFDAGYPARGAPDPPAAARPLP